MDWTQGVGRDLFIFSHYTKYANIVTMGMFVCFFCGRIGTEILSMSFVGFEAL